MNVVRILDTVVKKVCQSSQAKDTKDALFVFKLAHEISS